MKINTYAVNCNDAWLNTEGDDISGSYVKYKDHLDVVADLEAKCSALAAENAALKSAIQTHSESVHFCDLCGKDDPCSTDDVCMVLNETPATDAFLDVVRAQGVAMVIAYHRERADALHHVDRNNSIRHSMAALDASDVAAELRQEAAQ